MRAPEAPIGWPMAMAPPLTLTLEVSQPRSLLTAQACAAKASFASIRSRSSFFQPAFLSAARAAGIGPVPMIAGSTPARAPETMRARGGLPGLAGAVALARLDGHGNDLVLELAGLLRGFRLVLRSDREFILHLAGDLPLLGDILGGVTHVVAVEGVPQPVLDHGVDYLEVAHLHAVAQMLAVRRHAHRLLTARHHDLAVAVEDRLIAERDRAQAGTA